MKTTDLISALLDDVAEHGPREVLVSILELGDCRPIAEVNRRGGEVFLRDWREPTLFDEDPS